MGTQYSAKGIQIVFATTGSVGRLKGLQGLEIQHREAINITGPDNAAWETKIINAIKSVSPFTCRFYFDTAKTKITTGVNEQITITYGDASTTVIWGAITGIAWPDLDHDSTESLYAVITVTPTNINGSGVETGPA